MSRKSRSCQAKPGNLERLRFGRDGRLRPVLHCSATRVQIHPVRPGLLLFLASCVLVSWAQTADPQIPDPATQTLPAGVWTAFIVGRVTQHPWLATVLLAIGSLRIVLKPIMLAIEWYTKQTPNPDDDVAVLKFEAGPIYKWLSIGLDVLGSIKLPVLTGRGTTPGPGRSGQK